MEQDTQSNNSDRGNRSKVNEKFFRQAQKNSLGRFFSARLRNLREFRFKTNDGIITMMGKDRNDALLNLRDMIDSNQAPKRDLVRV